jgi:ribosomal protein S18 acetylase RimI-like enzyme
MHVLVRPARPDDDAAALLYESARAYYDAYAGSEARARRLLCALYPRKAHAASYQFCHVALLDGRVVGALAGFPALDGERLARRFVSLSLARLGPWHWPRLVRHLRASASVSPRPAVSAWYVDALAVDAAVRRRGVATVLLREAERLARESGAVALALDTGLTNHPAQALYEGYGFERQDERHAPNARAAKAIGGPGFVGYFKPVG